MTKVTIDRELLERLAAPLPGDNGWQTWHTIDMVAASLELRAILAAPRQPEGDGLEVVGLQWLDSGHYRKNPPKYGFNPHDWNELCRLSDAQRAITELRDRLDVMTQCADNYSRMFEESAEECSFLKECQENAMLHMTGLVAERDTLRQQLAERDATIERLEAGVPRLQEQSYQMRKQLAERDAQIASMRAEVTPFIETHWMPVARQRDKLAGLLREAIPDVEFNIGEGYEESAALLERIKAALAEVKPCQESPAPTT